MVAVALCMLADVVPLVDQRASAGGVAQEVHACGKVTKDKQVVEVAALEGAIGVAQSANLQA